MEWIDVKDLTKEIPFTKLCVWDGVNTYWAYLMKIEITQDYNNRTLFWKVVKPDGYPEVNVMKWMKITDPE